MKIFVISLESSKERRQFMSEQLQRLQLDFDFFNGVNGRSMTETELSEKCDFKWMKRYCGRILTRGEIGCALSHIEIYRQIVKENLPYALILEDDAWLTPSLVPLIAQMEEKLIFSNGGVFVLQECGSGHWNKAKGKKVQLTNLHFFSELRCACWTHAYIITQPSAKKMLDCLFPVTHVADCWGWLVQHGIITLYGLNFTFTTQNNCSLQSDIGMERFSVKRSLKERITRPLWRLFWLYYDKVIPLPFHRLFIP